MAKRASLSIAAGWHFELVPVQIVDDYRVTRDAFLVAVALCRFLNSKTGAAHPSWKTLEATARLHHRHLSRGIRALEKLGYLTRKRGGGRVSTSYVLHATRKRRS